MQNRWAANGKRSSAPPAAPARRLWSWTRNTCARLAPHSGPTEGRAVGWDTAHASCCPWGRAGLPLVLLELALLGLGAAARVAADETNTRGRPASPPKGRFAIKHPLPAQTSARASNSRPEPEPQKCGFLAIPGTFHFPSPAPCSPRPYRSHLSHQLSPLSAAPSMCPRLIGAARGAPSHPLRRSFWGQERPFSVAGRIFISAPSFLGKQPPVFGCSEPGAVSQGDNSAV